MREFMKAWADYKYSLFVVIPWHYRVNESFYADIERMNAESSFFLAYTLINKSFNPNNFTVNIRRK